MVHWCSPVHFHPPCLHCHVEVHLEEISQQGTTRPVPKDPCACHRPTGTVFALSSPRQHAQTPVTSLAGKTHN